MISRPSGFLAAIATAVFAATTPGCATIQYDKVKLGRIDGDLVVQWYKPDRFVFSPSKERPFMFIREDGTKIQPERFYTDGGSVPRPLWVLRSYSPWGYAPAFVVHDWIFYMKYCEYPGFESYSLERAAMVMAEVLKTMMESSEHYGGRNSMAFQTMYAAVQSPIAEELWNHGECNPASDEAIAGRELLATYTIEAR